MKHTASYAEPIKHLREKGDDELWKVKNQGMGGHGQTKDAIVGLNGLRKTMKTNLISI